MQEIVELPEYYAMNINQHGFHQVNVVVGHWKASRLRELCHQTLLPADVFDSFLV